MNTSSQEAKDKKMSLEELKRMGRAERQRMREERRRQKLDSDSESEYLVGKLAEIVRVTCILINLSKKNMDEFIYFLCYFTS